MSDNAAAERYALMMGQHQFIAEVFDLMDDLERTMTVREIATKLTARVLRTAAQFGISPVPIEMCQDGAMCEDDEDSAALVEAFLMDVRPPHDAHAYLDDYWNFLWEDAWPEGLAHVIFDSPVNDHFWAAELLGAVDRVVEDVGVPEPHWFKASDFEVFVGQWRANFIRELNVIKQAVDGIQAMSDLPFGDYADTYRQALPHFKSLLIASRRTSEGLNDMFKLLIEHFGEEVKPYAIQFAKDEGLISKLNLEILDYKPACLDDAH